MNVHLWLYGTEKLPILVHAPLHCGIRCADDSWPAIDAASACPPLMTSRADEITSGMTVIAASRATFNLRISYHSSRSGDLSLKRNLSPDALPPGRAGGPSACYLPGAPGQAGGRQRGRVQERRRALQVQGAERRGRRRVPPGQRRQVPL